MKTIVAVCVAVAMPALALAQPTCEERLAEIDERIASGNYPDQNVQLARTMRQSMAQMCGMFDEQMLEQMMDGFEDVLPVKTEEEKLAEREAKRRVADTSRAARNAAKAAQEQARPDSGLDSVAGQGRSVASGFVDRSEDMLNFWIWDWDMHEGKARILYTTHPSLEQQGRPDWQTYTYVVEMTPDGGSTQTLVKSKQVFGHAALALRRGHDEILLQRETGPGGSPTFFDRWSISGRKLLSSVPTPAANTPHGNKVSWMPFRGPTSDGNVIFIGTAALERYQTAFAWFEASPDGTVLGSGSLKIRGSDSTSLFMIPTNNGGGAFPLLFDVDEEIVRQYGGSEVKANIVQESRILTIGNDASKSRQSAVLSRMLMPTQMDMGSMQYMPELEHELMANRSIESLNVGPHAIPMIQPVGEGYVVLARFTGNRSRKIEIHGHWLIWVGSDKIEREVYLNPLSEDLNVNFVTFTVTEADEVILYGNSKDHRGTDYVVLLDKQGKPKATAAAKQPKNGKIEGMLADGKGVWLYGHGYPTDKFSRFRFWSERIDF